MRLTIQRLKKLIREEMTRLNEGAATMLILMAYLKYLNSQPTTDASGKDLPVKQDVERKRRIVTAVLFLHTFAVIMGHMMENVMSDEMDMQGEESRAIAAFYAMDPSEAQSIIDQLGMGSFSAEEILSVDEAELMDILAEYDPIGYYQQNA
jgi:hypothetical protein